MIGKPKPLDDALATVARGRMTRHEFTQLALAAGATIAAANTMFANAVKAEPK
jgi:peptide/nickel transport system substrate-binding protein